MPENAQNGSASPPNFPESAPARGTEFSKALQNAQPRLAMFAGHIHRPHLQTIINSLKLAEDPAQTWKSRAGSSEKGVISVTGKVYQFSSSVLTPKCSKIIFSASGFHRPLWALQHSSSFLKKGSVSPSLPKSSMAVMGMSNWV